MPGQAGSWLAGCGPITPAMLLPHTPTLAPHLGVGRELGGQAQLGQHLLHILGSQRLAHQAGRGGLLRQR